VDLLDDETDESAGRAASSAVQQSAETWAANGRDSAAKGDDAET